jgi:hypothetical protein
MAADPQPQSADDDGDDEFRSFAWEFGDLDDE